MALLGVTVWAIPAGDLLSEIVAVLQFPWGKQILLDLYVGFLIAAGLIYLTEENKSVALLWALPIFFFGNLVTCLWLVLRGSRLVALYRQTTPAQ